MKKFLTWTIVLLCIAVIAYVFFFLKGNQATVVDPYSIVPASASLVVEVELDSAIGEYKPWLIAQAQNNLSRIEGISLNPIAELPMLIARVDSLMANHQEWKTALSPTILFVSPLSGKSDLWTLIIARNPGASAANVEALIPLFSNVKAKRKFSGIEISEGKEERLAVVAECLVITSESSLMEEVILHAQKESSINGDRYFSEARRVSGSESPVHFFAANDHGWLQLDPEKSESKIQLSGYFVCDSSQSSLKAIGEKVKFELPHFFLSCNYLEAYASLDFESGWKREENAHSHPDAIKYWSQAWKDLGDSCQCDLNEAMLSWRGAVHGSGSAEMDDSTTAEFLFFSTTDAADAIQLLKPVLGNDTINGIADLKFSPAFDRNMNSSFPIQPSYVVQIGNWVFVGEERSELENLRNRLVADSSMGSTGFEAGKVVTQAEFYASPLPSPILNVFGGNGRLTTMISHFKENKWSVEVDLTGTPGNKDPELSAENLPTGETIVIPETHWSVINHNTQEKEVAWQDNENNFILADENGKVLWKKKLEEKIIGGVTQVDALKNGKLQMAFATKQMIHCIDRKGNELSGFPVSIPSGASSPLYVFDYSNDRNYRLLMGCNNGNVMNYTVEGKPTEGWKYEAHQKPVTEISWKKVNGDDYLFMNSVDTSKRAFRRNGVEVSTPN